MSEKYSYLQMETGDGVYTVVQCHQCGAYLINGTEQNIKHYKGCAPSNPKWFDEDIEDV